MPNDVDTPETPVTTRATQLFLVAVIGLAFVGFVVGLRQGVPSHQPPDFEIPPGPERFAEAVPAVPYAEFDRRFHGPNANWRSILADLQQPEIDLFAPPHFDESQREAVIHARAARRAFDGAPPVVPHPIDQMTATSCLACHGDGLFIGAAYAPRMSHELYTNCTQCHVEHWSTDFAQGWTVATLFVGLESPGRGRRAWPGAPPTIPHPTFMRENCMACHGPTGPDPIRSSHPWQANCLQCHAPSATLEQGVIDDSPVFLPPPPVREP